VGGATAEERKEGGRCLGVAQILLYQSTEKGGRGKGGPGTFGHKLQILGKGKGREILKRTATNEIPGGKERKVLGNTSACRRLASGEKKGKK